MALPNRIIFVRHGNSEGNYARAKAKKGDTSLFTSDFRERPDHNLRLTEDGREQAAATGRWIGEQFGRFDRYYVSPYARTKETAALLGLTNPMWRLDDRLRERDRGDMDTITLTEFQELFPTSAHIQNINALYWRPPGGESIADVKLRVRDVLDTLHRECAGQEVIIVTHGEFMWAARAVLEYMTNEEWLAADDDKSQRILNTHVLEYTRVDPVTGTIADRLGWWRAICPWKDGSDTGWRRIERRTYSNEDLLEQVARVPQLITGAE